jgi:hypothetical protein
MRIVKMVASLFSAISLAGFALPTLAASELPADVNAKPSMDRLQVAQGMRPETNPQAPLRPDDRSGRPETNPQAPLRPDDRSGRPETNPQAPLRPDDRSGRPETNPQAPLRPDDKSGRPETNPQAPLKK